VAHPFIPQKARDGAEFQKPKPKGKATQEVFANWMRHPPEEEFSSRLQRPLLEASKAYFPVHNARSREL